MFEKLADRLLGSRGSQTAPYLFPNHFKAAYLKLVAIDAASSGMGTYRHCGAGVICLWWNPVSWQIDFPKQMQETHPKVQVMSRSGTRWYLKKVGKGWPRRSGMSWRVATLPHSLTDCPQELRVVPKAPHYPSLVHGWAGPKLSKHSLQVQKKSEFILTIPVLRDSGTSERKWVWKLCQGSWEKAMRPLLPLTLISWICRSPKPLVPIWVWAPYMNTNVLQSDDPEYPTHR